LSPQSLHDEKSLETAGRQLLAHFGLQRLVVITRGRKREMSIFEESSPRHLSIPAHQFLK